MAVHPCPVCGLRYTNRSELDDHVSAEHTQQLPEEEQETIRVPRAEGGDDQEVLQLPW